MSIPTSRKDTCLLLLREKYDARLVDEYVLFAENRAGTNVWNTFAGKRELYHDIDLFREALAIVVMDDDYEE